MADSRSDSEKDVVSSGDKKSELGYHHERVLSHQTNGPHGFKVARQGGGDTAMALFSSPDDVTEPYDAAEDKAALRKVDWMILPYISVCYAFFYIDKTTLSYAAIFGIRDDLDLDRDNRYQWLSSIFYFGFLVWALPTNYLLQKLPVARYLGFNIFLWGILLMCQAASKNFATLAVLRALSGAAESCSDPAFVLITSMWYTRREQPLRIGIWYTANGFGIALGGLLGYGIGHIKGALASWRYEFLIIGALCCLWGLVIFFLLPNSPVTAPLLSHREKRVVVERLRENQTGVENKTFKRYQFVEAATDYKTYLFFIIAACANTPNGGISNFGTLIIQGLDFDTLITTVLQVPYGILIAITILMCVYLNDWVAKKGYQSRIWFVILSLLPIIAAAFGLLYAPQGDKIGRLILYYVTGLYNGAFVIELSLFTANTAGHTKKVLTNASLFLGYCTGNIIGPFFYKTDQAPVYTLGLWSIVVSMLLNIVAVLVLRFLLKRENGRRDRLQADATAAGRHTEETAFGDLTDRENMNFRYIY